MYICLKRSLQKTIFRFVVGVDERAGHVVERHMELGLLVGEIRSNRICSVMSVMTVTAPPAAIRRRRIRSQRPSGV